MSRTLTGSHQTEISLADVPAEILTRGTVAVARLLDIPTSKLQGTIDLTNKVMWVEVSPREPDAQPNAWRRHKDATQRRKRDRRARHSHALW